MKTTHEYPVGGRATGKTQAKARAAGKPILDVACGGKMFYFDKHDPLVLFCDNRRINTTLCDGRTFEVDPDVVADFTQLPFDDGAFKVVVFDPPHLVHNDTSPVTGYQHIKYGALHNGWQDMLRKGFCECFRVLAGGGVLIFKWNETDIKVADILKLAPARPIIGHKSGKTSKTHWLMFYKADFAASDADGGGGP